METQNKEEESKNELQHKFHTQQQEILKMKERIAILEFENQNINEKINPKRSKILQMVEKIRFLHDEERKQLQEIKKHMQYQRELEINGKRNKKEVLKQSINDAVKFAQEHIKEERKNQAKEMKVIHAHTKNIIDQNKNLQLSAKRIKKKVLKEQEKQSLENVKQFQKEKKEKVGKAVSLEKIKMKNEIENQQSELQKLEQLEMIYLSKLQQSKSQEQVFKDRIKNAYEMNIEEYRKMYGKIKK